MQAAHVRATFGKDAVQIIGPFVPVTDAMDRGLVRMSMTFGDCSHGTLK